ncbi:hypothetical protein, partial [Blastococcus mobilis]
EAGQPGGTTLPSARRTLPHSETKITQGSGRSSRCIRAKTPGTWHDSDPTAQVDWSVAVAAWVEATEPILERVAATYNGTIRYEQLRDQLFDETGYRTRSLMTNWISQVLGPVQNATRAEAKPPLTSLVVLTGTGGVGPGYINHEHPAGDFTSDDERQRAAAVDRLTCYRTYCEHVPEDAAPQMTPVYVAKQTRRQKPDPRPRRTCPMCNTVLPASGRCDYCD